MASRAASSAGEEDQTLAILDLTRIHTRIRYGASDRLGEVCDVVLQAVLERHSAASPCVLFKAWRSGRVQLGLISLYGATGEVCTADVHCYNPANYTQTELVCNFTKCGELLPLTTLKAGIQNPTLQRQSKTTTTLLSKPATSCVPHLTAALNPSQKCRNLHLQFLDYSQVRNLYQYPWVMNDLQANDQSSRAATRLNLTCCFSVFCARHTWPCQTGHILFLQR